MARSRVTGNGNVHFAHWLKAARRAAGVTQEDLAEAMGVSQSAIFDWEHRGLETMTPKAIRDLARTLEVPPVEVADALGYPTRPRHVYASPLPPHVLEERISDLSLQLGRVVEDWAIDLFPARDEEHESNDQRDAQS